MTSFLPQQTYSIPKHEGGRRLARYVCMDSMPGFHVLQVVDNNQVVRHYITDIKEIEENVRLNKITS